MREPEPARPRSPEELRWGLIRRSLERDEEFAFWRDASAALRGETHYHLFAQATAIRVAAPRFEQPEQRILRPGGREIRRRA